MSGIVVSALRRQDRLSPRSAVSAPDPHGNDDANQVPHSAADRSTESGISAAARFARRSIASSPLALAIHARASVLHLLR